MTSKKGAKEETKKKHKFGQTRSKKKVLKLKGFKIFFLRGEGVRGDLGGSVRGGRRSSAGTPGERHPQLFSKIEVFS